MHALAEYGLMHVKLYEDIARYGHVSISYDYPVMVNGRYLMSPSPIPAFDNPKLHMMPALQLFGAGREKRIYAVPPYTAVVASISTTIRSGRPARRRPAACAAPTDSYLDEVVTDDRAAGCSSAPTPIIARAPAARATPATDGHDAGWPRSDRRRIRCWPRRGALTLRFGAIPALRRRRRRSLAGRGARRSSANPAPARPRC